MLKISKIFLVTISIVTILALMVVPSFADSITSPDVAASYPFVNLRWEGTSLAFDSPDVLMDYDYDELNRFSIDNVFAQVGDADYVTLSDGYLPNRTNIRFNTAYNPGLSSEVLYRGLYHQRNLFSIDSFSYCDVFFIDDLMHYNGTLDNTWADSIRLVYAIPNTLYNDLVSSVGNYSDYFKMRFTYSFEYFVRDETGTSWQTANGYLDYEAYDDVILPVDRYFGELQLRPYQARDFDEDGFITVSIKLPIDDALDLYVQDYFEDSYKQSILVRNLNCYMGAMYDYEALADQLFYIGEQFGDSDFLNDYYHAVIPNGTEERPFLTLPLHSVVTSAENLSYNPSYSALQLMDQLFDTEIVIQNPVYLKDFNLVDWLGDSIGRMFDVKLFGGENNPNGFSLAYILYAVLGIGLVMMVIKFFAGG